MPDTGGANVPALNDLLSSWGIVLGDTVYDGEYAISKQTITYASGTHIARFPSNGVILAAKLSDQGLFNYGILISLINSIIAFTFTLSYCL